jgi:hypothetical protein
MMNLTTQKKRRCPGSGACVIQKVFFTSKIWLPGKTQLCPQERLERLSCRLEAKYLALRQSRGVNFAGKYTPSSYRI